MQHVDLKGQALASWPRGAFQRLLAYPELVFEVTKYLDIDEVVSLYAISKDFHILINRRITAFIYDQARLRAPEASQIFIHRCYKNLCLHDPAGRRLDDGSDVRAVPSFRWLKMIVFRTKTVAEIIQELRKQHHLLHQGTEVTLMKLWFTLDISDNLRRIGILHNRAFWSDGDLYMITHFIIKLDMRLTHPVTGNGETGLRTMLLNQRSLSILARVLKRDLMKTQLDMLCMKLRYNYEPNPKPTHSVFGIAPSEIGRLQYEGWGAGSNKFIPVDKMIAREAVRRNLKVSAYALDMMIYGYIDRAAGRNIHINQALN